MDAILDLILRNFHFALLLISLALAAFHWSGESFCRYMLLLPIGVGSLCGFFLHAFEPEYIAHKLGWVESPFQFQVAAANLGLGVAGIVAFWKSWDFAFAVTLMAICLLMGTAFIHIFEGLFWRDYTIGNIGGNLYTDLLIPTLLTLTLCYWYQEEVARQI